MTTPRRSAAHCRMQDVAAEAGVHQTTVSRALRNDPRIPAETVARVREVAERLGYRPHPLVSALIAIRRARKPPRDVAPLAFIYRANELGDSGNLHLRGAREAAERHGYRLEAFGLHPSSMPAKRLDAILTARNVPGVIIGPLPEADGNFSLQWQHYCTVVIEYTFVSPAFDRVVHDSYAGMRRILQECRKRGFRRIGVVLSRSGHDRTQWLNAAGYWVEQRSDPNLTGVEPLILDAWDDQGFQTWLTQHNLDVVVTSNVFLAAVRQAARTRRHAQRFEVINVNAFPGQKIAGIEQDHLLIGATAARLLIDKVVRNDRGIPESACTTLTPGRWVGDTWLRRSP